jgi:uncharacterized membrane protein YdfJ with MMPL/SSD domain
MFSLPGRRAYRSPALCIVAWLVAAGVLAALSPSTDQIARAEPESRLPADEPHNLAPAFQDAACPETAPRTPIVLAFQRRHNLRAADERLLRELPAILDRGAPATHGAAIQSPYA